MLWGLESSEVELSMGVMREVWQGSELAEICQQCHMSVMGHNSIPLSRISAWDPEVCGRPMEGLQDSVHSWQGLKQRLTAELSWWMAKFRKEFWRNSARGYKPSESCKRISSSSSQLLYHVHYSQFFQHHHESHGFVCWWLWQWNRTCRMRGCCQIVQGGPGHGRGLGKGSEDKGSMGRASERVGSRSSH